ncbi:tRNA (adenine(22)-N(1))-methyltransferase [Serpentinicella alkaliphila]|uniref:tRNA (Adenine22-N1)-methyltransferase n=1 Tax=Serpentinicella alkaliphila TaxID=1734049 RepID=A0A4R2UJS7_9FIRM|nr:class I SAM-dependent methyltransferase [Serpentinicella alkaliphila]QUH26837.1 SAM-dependent methyltransferase [Serpentinicella alkaliphila]TCQ08063.1 tRNA (adenine22-N1)-methyltransferase [Serpentinicella alkaliphila]
MEIQLTPRLKMIAMQVIPGSRVVDVGTDHGYIPIYLIQNKLSDFVIASDVNEGPIKSAKNNIERFKCNGHIETRLGSGLETISPGEINTAIIAGMGGILITELLDANVEITKSIKNFILQPMQAQNILRKHLVQNGFKIVKDLLVKEDNKIYEIIVATEGKQEVSNELYFDIGFYLNTNPKELAIEFIGNKINKEKRIINQIESANMNNTVEIYETSKLKLIQLEEVLSCLELE